MKYIIELEKVEGTDFWITKGAQMLVFNQTMIDDNILTPYEESEEKVDWSKVPVDTKIEVRNSEDLPWRRAYFAGCRNGDLYAWHLGGTSFTISEKTPWKFARLYKEDR